MATLSKSAEDDSSYTVCLRLDRKLCQEIEKARVEELEAPTRSAWIRRAIKRDLIREKEGRYGYDQRTGESTAQ